MSTSISIQQILDQRPKNPAEAREYLNAVLAEGDPQAIKIAIRDVIRARGGIAEVARTADLKRETLSRALSARGNPRFDTLLRILNATHLRLQVADAATEAV